jgi:glyoxylase-like metal-dependent hydrolase (beta-lactamase superfamily II)
MKIGKYSLKIINSGFIGLDGGAMFGIIPKPLWQKTNPPDEQNRVTLATRNLLLESESKKILIDTGMGTKWDDKLKDIYKIDPNLGLELELKHVGILSGEITDVILTHLHFDHTGGSTKPDNDKLSPAFPNAKYHVQKTNFEWAMNPSDRDKGSYIKHNFEPLAKEGVLKFTNDDQFFDDEIQFKVINGHTFGQQMIKISDGSTTLLYCCDLMPFVSHIRIPYIMGYDLQPLVTLEEKKKYLKVAADENWYLFFGHDPEIALATVKHSDKGIIRDNFYKTFDEL